MKMREIAGPTDAAGTKAGAVGTASSPASDSFIVAWGRRDPNFVSDRRNKIETTKMTKARGAEFKRSQLAWPDKVGLVTAAVIAVLYTFICVTMLMAAGSMFYVRLNHTLAEWAVRTELALVVPIWLLMRAIDFGADGPSQRRRGR